MDYINIVNEISKRFFYDYIVNINILIPNPFLREEILMFTYYPYKPKKCSQCNVELQNVFDNNRFLSKRSHFPNKLQTFYNCTIVVAAFNTTPYVKLVKDSNGEEKMFGFEGKLFRAVAEVLNLNIKVIVSPLKWGSVYPNRTYTGAIALVCVFLFFFFLQMHKKWKSGNQNRNKFYFRFTITPQM